MSELDCEEWTGRVNDAGYGVVWDNTIKRPVRAHRLAWEAEHGPIPDGMCVLHRCDNPPCVRLDHLRLGTHADNMADMIAKRRNPCVGRRSEAHQMAKLTAEQVIEIRERHAAGGITQRQLAAEYGVSYPHVSLIVRRKTWKHLP